MTRRFLIAFAVLALLPTLSHSAQSAGWVDSFNCDSAGYEIQRGDTSVPVAIYLQLENGDRITVKKDACEVQLSLADSQTTLLGFGMDPFVVASSTETPSVMSNLLAWAGSSINVWHEDQNSSARHMEMRTRGNEDANKPKLTLPLYLDETVAVVAGQRSLFVSWRQGRGPYSVKISTVGMTPLTLFEASGMEGERLKTGILDLRAGMNLLLEVGDSGETLSRRIVVKGQDDLPPAERILLEKKDESFAVKTVYATWLSGNYPEWAYEAYQQVAGISDQYVPARLLNDALETGMLPE